MRVIVVGLLACLVAASPTAAHEVRFDEAHPGPTYFNRPGATLEDHNRDLAYCSRFLGSIANAAWVDNSLVGYLLFRVEGGGWVEGGNAGRIETCMVTLGWRVYRLGDEEARSLSTQSDAEVAQAVSSLVGSSEPRGSFLRRWNNEAAHPQGRIFAFGDLRPPPEPGLSMRSFRHWLAQQPEPEAPAARPELIEIRRDRRPATTPPNGMAMIFFRVKGVGSEYGPGIRFAEILPGMSPTSSPRASHVIHGFVGSLGIRREGNWLSYTVPPGRWALSWAGRFGLCLGAPSFEVEEGEVIYAGAYDISAANLGPDLDLAPALEYLGGNADGRLQAAAYDRNGDTFPCGNHPEPIYSLEIEGLPFAPGYGWGSRATLHVTTEVEPPAVITE